MVATATGPEGSGPPVVAGAVRVATKVRCPKSTIW